MSAKSAQKPKRIKRLPKTTTQKIKNLSESLPLRLEPLADLGLLDIDWRALNEKVKDIPQERPACVCDALKAEAVALLEKEGNGHLIEASTTLIREQRSLVEWSRWIEKKLQGKCTLLACSSLVVLACLGDGRYGAPESKGKRKFERL